MIGLLIVIVGAGGHGREVHGLITARPHEQPLTLLGFLDDDPHAGDRLERLGARHMGPLSALDSLGTDIHLALGLGSSALRRSVDAQITSQGRPVATLIHPSAVIGPDVRMGEGVVVSAQSSVTTNVSLGRHAHVNVGASVAHDVILGDYVTVSPGCRVSGGVTVGIGATLGSGCVILPGVRIGADAVVGAGAVVTRDVPEATTVMGVPARIQHPREEPS